MTEWFAAGKGAYRAADFQNALYEDDREQELERFGSATWLYYDDVRASFRAVAAELCPHVVKIAKERYPKNQDVREFFAEHGAGNMAGGSYQDEYMWYWFSDPDDAFYFKLTFA